jgi:ATP-binding cassette subfamily F protein uup
MSIGASRLGKKVFEIKHLSKSYADQTLIQDLNYIVLPDDRVGIIGPNGSGKSTLLNILAGLIPPDTGTIDIGQTVQIGYYTQENIEMNEQLRVIEYINEVAEVIHTVDGKTITAAQMLERFLFSPDMQWTPVAKLSGGERRRLYLLRILMSGPNVLLLDEPTNDLDTQTLSILEDYLEQFPGAVITVSHDRYFLDRTVDHLFAFEDSGKIRHFSGNYSTYLEIRKNEKEQALLEMKIENSTQNTGSRNPEHSGGKHSEQLTSSGEKKSIRKLSYNDQKEWDQIEERIAALEERSTKLEREISLAGSDSEKVQVLFKEEQQVTIELEKTVERWSELSELVEEIERNKG